jgi:DNA excision repair protein ERCC-2
MQKVVQAAGRVIRTQEDKGVVVLIDDRFARPAVRELLPAWWRVAGRPAVAGQAD